jgi:hypothetical protein
MANALALALNKDLNFKAWAVFIAHSLIAVFDTKAEALRYILHKGISATAYVKQI